MKTARFARGIRVARVVESLDAAISFCVELLGPPVIADHRNAPDEADDLELKGTRDIHDYNKAHGKPVPGVGDQAYLLGATLALLASAP